MKVIIVEEINELIEVSGEVITEEIKENGNTNILLSTSPLLKKIYENVSSIIKEDEIDISNTNFISISKDELGKVEQFLNNNIFKPLEIKNNNIKYPSDIKNSEYLKEKLNIGLAIISLNEYGYLDNIIESKSLKETIYFDTTSQKLNIGIPIIMKSQKIILVAIGKECANYIQQLLEEAEDEKFVASKLLDHENILLVCDNQAASLLENIEE